MDCVGVEAKRDAEMAHEYVGEEEKRRESRQRTRVEVSVPSKLLQK